MLRYVSHLAAACLALALASPPARAQGRQTAVLTGTVTSSDGASVPGATVTITSPALQGLQMAVTDDNGAVAAEAPVVTNPTVGANIDANTVNMLPLATRRPVNIALLSPAVNDNTPNVGQLSISGSFAYDNVFLIDGVDVNDNTFGTSNNLFVEDAIQETQVLTSGISAEYGRFSGGVINVVTKRGGDSFSGSVRSTLSNPSWQDENPFEESSNVTHPDRLGKVYEGTFGGPVLRSKVWFFSSGRYEDTLDPQTLRETGTSFTLGTTNRRGQIKLTGTVVQGQTVSGSYMNNSTEQRDRPAVASVDQRSLDPARTLPNDLLVIN